VSSVVTAEPVAGVRAPAVERVVAPPPPPTSDALRPRYAHLDGVRAIAAMSVLIYHVGLKSFAVPSAAYGNVLSRLDVAVPIFFVLSGFLLYRPFVAARLAASRRRA
jgi:peptidoglycan/LPS O-acetylase OafA/YrhL